MNAIDAHKDELEKLLDDLSSDRVVSGITFVALVDAYITRLDTNCSDLNACVTPPPAQTDSELTYGTNIDSKLRALLRATQTSKRRAAFFQRFRATAGKQAPDLYLRLPLGSGRLALYQDNGR
jgi:hypothetical protein